MSGKWHQLYTVDYTKDAPNPPKNRSCGPKDYEVGWNAENF